MGENEKCSKPPPRFWCDVDLISDQTTLQDRSRTAVQKTFNTGRFTLTTRNSNVVPLEREKNTAIWYLKREKNTGLKSL